MEIPWALFAHGRPMAFWTAHGHPMGVPWSTHGSEWTAHGLGMVSPWADYGPGWSAHGMG